MNVFAPLPTPTTTEALDAPFQEALRTAEAEADGNFDFFFTGHSGDLNADGKDDLLAHHWKLAAADAGVGYSGTVTLTALSGAGGKRLWRVRQPLSNSLPIPAQTARVGPRGERGALLLIDSHSPTFSLGIVAISARGETVWERSFESTYSYETPFAATNLPTGLQLFDAIDGTATDMLIGLLDYADAVAHLRVAVLDGRDGTLMMREPVETGVGAFPTLAAAGDLDLDRKDDYVVTGYAAGDQGHIGGYSGNDGTPLWHQSELELAAPSMWALEVGRVGRGRIPDIAVGAPSDQDQDRFHLLEGETGKPMWSGEGTFPYPLGDTNSDRSRELGVTSVWDEGDRMGEEFRAYTARGSLLYQRRYAVPSNSCAPSCSVLSYLLDAGDLDNDGSADLFVQRYVQNQQETQQSNYLVTGRAGHRHLRGSEGAVPVLASFDGRGDDLVRLERRRTRHPMATAFDGRSGVTLWKARIQGPLLGTLEPYNSSASVTRDRNPDLFVTHLHKGPRVTVLDGDDGSVVWSRSL